MEAHVFDRAQFQEAYTKINQAADQNPKEAFIYAAVSLGTLIGGYTIGDWYDLGTFSGDTVQQALGYALTLNLSAFVVADAARLWVYQVSDCGATLAREFSWLDLEGDDSALQALLLALGRAE